MSFYLLPPTGTVPLHKLEEYATKRLQFLLRLHVCSNQQEVESVLEDASVVEQSDCLITNTAKDEISHHILRLALGGDQESRSFLCDSELALFKLRVENMVANEWNTFFKSTEKFLCRFQGSIVADRPIALSDVGLVFKILKAKFESWNRLSTDICGNKAGGSVNLPFRLVLRLVAGRLVDVVKGLAMVPVSLLKEVFIELFERLMAAATLQASEERELVVTDDRIRRLAATLKGIFRAETKPSGHYLSEHFPGLRLADVWAHRLMYPPCMANVVQRLQEEHTLTHQDRIQLTLFLKELGLPVHDALLLWKREYSLPIRTSKARSCQGRWHGNQRRYIYNIRHLYGLEGSRTNYRAHSCSVIQGRALSCHDAGGCPFVSPVLEDMEQLFLKESMNKSSIETILELCHGKMYGHACQIFMKNKLKPAGDMHNFVSGERNIKTEISNSHSKSANICDRNVNICQERSNYNEITRKRRMCVARLELDSYEDKLLSNPDRLLSDPNESKLLSNFGKNKLLSYSADGKWLSNMGEDKLLSHSTESKWISNHTEDKLLTNPAEYKLAKPDEDKLSLYSTEHKWLSNTCEAKLLSNPSDHKLSNPAGNEQISCNNTLTQKHQIKSPEVCSSLSTAGGALPVFDPLNDSGPTGLVKNKTCCNCFCKQSQNDQLFDVECSKKRKGRLPESPWLESAISVKKPRDVYWLSVKIQCQEEDEH